MIKIAQDRDLATLIGAFSCEAQRQQRLIDAWIRATEERWGAARSHFRCPRPPQGWKPRRELRAMEECRELGKPVSHRQRGLVSGNDKSVPTRTRTLRGLLFARQDRPTGRVTHARPDQSVFSSRLLPAVVYAVPGAAPPQGGVIQVDVVALRNNKGRVFCSLYASAEGFPKDGQKELHHDTSSISETKASSEFSGIAPGTYAVSVFHDENSNGKLDTNFLGIPREGGASNDRRGHRGPPDSMQLSSNLPEAG